MIHESKMLLQVMAMADGRRSKTMTTTPQEFADLMALAPPEFKLQEHAVIILFDQVTGEWAPSELPVLNCETFHTLFATKEEAQS